MTPYHEHAIRASDLALWLASGWPWYVAAFFIGSIPFGLIVGRVFFKTDIRSEGSGNIGAANALRTMGRGAGIAVLGLDAVKGIVSTALPYVVSVGAAVSPSTASLCALCALAAILGHCYSPWLRFKGGKGVATLLGVFIIASWPSAVAFVAIWLAIVLPTGFASLGSIAGTLAGIAVIAFAWGPASLVVSGPAAALIVWKHRENISRLFSGTENKLDLLKRRGA